VIVLKIFVSVSNFDLPSGNTHEHALLRNQNRRGRHDHGLIASYFPVRSDETVESSDVLSAVSYLLHF
jgi:hypothetical protein